MYMCILCPAAVGKEDSFVLYSKEKDKKNSTNYYSRNQSIDGEYYYEKKKTVLKGQPNNEITRGELKPRLQMWTAKGIIKKNKCKTDASTCAYGTTKGTYKEGTCSSCGKVHVDLRDKMTFRKQSKKDNCTATCKSIISETGVTPEGAIGDESIFEGTKYNQSFYQLANENTDRTELIFYKEKSKEAIVYLNNQLDEGYPVLAGVNHTYKYKGGVGINEGTTDHYVIIVGKSCEEGILYYQFWDVGSQNGDNDKYKFKLLNNEIVSEVTYSGKKYTVTQIRRNNL